MAMFNAFEELDQMGLLQSAVAPLYARAGELVSRLSGLYALSDAVMDLNADLYSIKITPKHVIWALALVKLSIEQITPEVEENASHGEGDAIRKRIATVIKSMIAAQDECIKQDGKTYVRLAMVRSRAKNSRKYRSFELTSELRGMIEDVEIESISVGEEGIKPTEYVRIRG